MAAFVEQVTELSQWTDHAMSAGQTVGRSVYAPPPRKPDQRSPTRQGDHRTALLNQIVETGVLPRLVLAQRADVLRRNALRPAAVEAGELVHLLLTEDLPCILAFVERLQAGGATPETLYLGVMTDAARSLHDLSRTDRADPVRITIANGYLQQLVRALAPAFQTSAVTRVKPARVLLTTAPGEQHAFGLSVLNQFFHRAGWHVIGSPGASPAEAVRTLNSAWIDVAAFSIGSERVLGALAQQIRQARRASRNPGLRVMVGGPLYLVMRRLALRVGADTAAADAWAAVRLADDMLAVLVAAE